MQSHARTDEERLASKTSAEDQDRTHLDNAPPDEKSRAAGALYDLRVGIGEETRQRIMQILQPHWEASFALSSSLIC